MAGLTTTKPTSRIGVKEEKMVEMLVKRRINGTWRRRRCHCGLLCSSGHCYKHVFDELVAVIEGRSRAEYSNSSSSGNSTDAANDGGNSCDPGSGSGSGCETEVLGGDEETERKKKVELEFREEDLLE